MCTYVKDNAVVAHAHSLFYALCEAMPIDNNSTFQEYLCFVSSM